MSVQVKNAHLKLPIPTRVHMCVCVLAQNKHADKLSSLPGAEWVSRNVNSVALLLCV